MLGRDKLLHLLARFNFERVALFFLGLLVSAIPRRVDLSIDSLQFEPFTISHNKVLTSVIVYALL